jgi:hypothetical protein
VKRGSTAFFNLRWIMPDRLNESKFDRLVEELYPLSGQAARVLDHFGHQPDSISKPDHVLAAQIGEVSAQHVAIVKHALIGAGLADEIGFSVKLVDAPALSRLAANFEGVAHYLRVARVNRLRHRFARGEGRADIRATGIWNRSRSRISF